MPLAGMHAVHGEAVDVDPVQGRFDIVPERALAHLHRRVVDDVDLSVFMVASSLDGGLRASRSGRWWSCRAASGCGSPASSASIFLASTLPSSTPHWSKLLMPQSTPWTKILCSYSAISAPRRGGVRYSSRMRVARAVAGEGLVRRQAFDLGQRQALVPAGRRALRRRLAAHQRLRLGQAVGQQRGVVVARSSCAGRSAAMNSTGITSVPWCSSWK